MSDPLESLPRTVSASPITGVTVGEMLAGKYRVDAVLGLGGMGVVVSATHVQLARRVALKFMLPGVMHRADLVERFSREARAAVRLKSDHVARVLDVGTLESGSPFIVMEFLEGSDLGDLIERSGPMPVEVAVDCVMQACDAVAEAHSLGIIHRDLKPRNLFMTGRNDGRPLVKVLDFGISKQVTEDSLSLTRTTEVVGSPNYMSPEQLRSARGADERSDIWALGVILYELLTGQVPFVAETITQLTVMVMTEPPRALESIRGNVPAALREAIARCLEKDPSRRFPTVAALAAALQPFASVDVRNLAERIARIGPRAPSGRGPAVTLDVPSVVPPTVGSGMTASVAGGVGISAPPQPPRRSAAPRVLAVLAGLVLVLSVVAFFAWPRRRMAPLAAPVAADAPRAAAPAPSETPLEPLTPPAIPSAREVPSALASSVPSVRVTPPAPASGSPVAHGARGKLPSANAPAPSSPSSDEPPRYRTTW